MLKSIKSKITVLTFAILCILAIAITGVASLSFYNDKEMTIAAGGLSISSLAENLNKEITKLEKNALDLALMGEIYNKAGKKEEIGIELLTGIFQNYPDSLGGGIWFKPYVIQPDKKRSCLYAFRNSNDRIVMDYSYQSEEYNYLQQSWYTEIMAELEKGKKIFWAKPYYEDIGAKTLMTTVGAGIYIDGKLIGLSTVDWRMDDILNEILKIKPTTNSFALFADKINDYIIAYAEPDVDKNMLMGKSLKVLPWYTANLAEGKVFEYKGKKYIPYIKQLDNGMFLIVNVPLAELFHDALRNLCILLALLLLSSALIALILYKVLRRNINEPISKLTETAQEISRGDLEKTIFLEEPTELVKLANSFNKMKTDIKTQLMELSEISLEKEKMASELAIAKTIQDSALPKDFPHDECFELVASMTPAREVGGDFYDFFPIDETHYAFVIADVSGKGITAALYMMSAKTAIKNMLQAGYDIEDAINRANKTICENNVEGMFVTAFIGIINLATGEVQYINAGHCSPLLKNEAGYQYFNTRLNLVLGAFPEYCYKSGKFKLKPGNRLFLYTDGVTEAQTKNLKMYGTERLQQTLNQKEMPLSDTLKHVHKSIKNFVKNAPQFDDVTMLALEFHHKK